MGVTTSRRGIVRVVNGASSTTTDAVAVEAPLTIILDGEVLVTTMRTPGHDLDLVAGWLVNESSVRRPGDIAGMGAFAAHEDDDGVDTVRVSLATGVTPPRPRAFVTSSACGVCSADVLAAFTGPDAPLHTEGWSLPADAIPALIDGMRDGQRMFDQTGALHAAALVSPALEPLWVREDVGRHNAVDKVIGKALFEDRVPLTDHTLVVSGRISYEIVHKALTACIGAVVAVSGPTSLAIDLARAHGLVLAGFARGDRVNVYSGDDRVTTEGLA
jgi:FdhD protein